MSKLILITGDLAAGKSLLADNLSKKLGVLAIKKDIVKEKLVDIIGFKTREENKLLSLAAVQEMIHVFENSIVSNTDIILEANFHEDEMEQIKNIVDKNNAEVVALKLIGDIDLIYERFLSRVPTRHIAHMSQGLDKDKNAFIKYIDGLRNEIIPFEYKTIDITDKTAEEVLNASLEIINRY